MFDHLAFFVIFPLIFLFFFHFFFSLSLWGFQYLYQCSWSDFQEDKVYCSWPDATYDCRRCGECVASLYKQPPGNPSEKDLVAELPLLYLCTSLPCVQRAFLPHHMTFSSVMYTSLFSIDRPSTCGQFKHSTLKSQMGRFSWEKQPASLTAA